MDRTGTATRLPHDRLDRWLRFWPFPEERPRLKRTIRGSRGRLRTIRNEGGTRSLNFVVQRLFRINADAPWSVHYTSRILCPQRLYLGKGVAKSLAVSPGLYIQAVNGVSIGDNTLLGPGVRMISANHSRERLESHIPDRPIVIGRNCWIGANAVILPAVGLGDRCVVGAGTVVTRDFPPDSVIVGNPARSIENRVLRDTCTSE